MNSNLKPLCFVDDPAEQLETTGGKDAKLNPSAAAETKALSKFVVGAETYRAWFSQLSSSLPVTLAVENAQALESHCRDLREQLRKMPMPAAIDVDLRRKLSALCQQGPVSVRASTTMEDGLNGQSIVATHDTYSGVVGVDAVIARIIDCFVSMWDDKSVKKRSDRGLDPANIGITVVVKQMVDESQIPYHNRDEYPDHQWLWV